MAEIHSLTGNIPEGGCNTDLVDALKGLLERAERGEIVSLAWAGYSGLASDTVLSGWDCAGGTLFHLHSSIAILAHRFAENMNEA